MRCPACQLDNRPDRRHCATCGRALVRHCPVCAFLNLPDERHCGGCGADRLTEADRDRIALLEPAAATGAPARAAAPGEPVPDAAPPPTDRGSSLGPTTAERRQLTVMFCDLAGSTAMSQSLDLEDLSEVNRAYQDTATQAIQRFGGYVARYMGDGVLAYFGYPLAHEDDAVRAARAGLALVEDVHRLSSELGARKGVELSVRVGVATGLVVVGDVVGEAASQEHTVVGETPNLAARLQALAEPDTVLVSDATRNLLGRHFELRDMGSHRVKGFDESVRVWRVAGQSNRQHGGESLDEGGGDRAPLRGRDAELVLLVDRWERARAGDGQIVLLCGEAGFGKTRLARELCRRATKDAVEVIRYDVSSFHEGTMLHPVLQSLATRAGLDEAIDAASKVERLERFLAPCTADPKLGTALLAPLLSLPLPEGHPVVELEGAARLDRTFTLLLDELDHRALGGPLLLIADGLHAADPTTLAFVDRLVDHAPDHRMLVVLTFRPPLARGWSSKRHVGALDLGRLRRNDVEVIARAIAGDPPIAKAVLALVAERTDGVPLFVEELTRALVSSGDLVERRGERELDAGGRTVTIPTTVQDSLMARLDRMGEAKSLAQVAAVLGREIPVALLARVLERSAAELDTALEPLVSGQIVTLRGRGDGAVLAFRQTMLRDAAYESLLLSRRRELHARAAAALRELDPNVAEREPELLARHHTLADQPVLALELWERAGRHAVERVAHAEAIGHFTAALAALARLPAEERTGEAAIARRLALELALIGSCRVAERFEQALAHLDSAEAVATQHDRLAELSRVHAFRGAVFFFLGRIDDSLAEQQEALRMAEAAGGAGLLAQAHGGLGDAYYQLTDMAASRRHYERCIAISREHGLERIEAAHLPVLGLMHAFDLDFGRAREHCEAGLALAQRCGHRRAAMICCTSLAQVCYETGPEEVATAAREQALAHARALGALTFVATSHFFHARHLAMMGQLDEARAAVAQSDEAGRTLHFYDTMRVFHLGTLALTARSGDELTSILTEGLDLISGQKTRFGDLFFYPQTIEATLRARRWDDAAALIQRAETLPAAETARWFRYQLDRGRALLAWGRDGPTDALRVTLGSLLEEARTLRFGSQTPLLEAALAGEWPADSLWRPRAPGATEDAARSQPYDR